MDRNCGLSWQDGGELVGLWNSKLVVGVAESEELGNRNICRTGTLVVRRIALLVVGRKVVKKFFSDVAKNRENVAEKCGEVIEKAGQKRLVKNITFLQRQQINQLDEMKNAVITVTIRSLKSG